MAFEYKCVGAPERARRKKGAKTRTDRVALAMQEAIAQEATDGWEYLRTDLIPIEERSGMFGRTHEVHRAVMVFRRSLVRERAQEPELSAPQHPARAEESIRLAADHGEAPDPVPRGELRRTPNGLG